MLQQNYQIKIFNKLERFFYNSVHSTSSIKDNCKF